MNPTAREIELDAGADLTDPEKERLHKIRRRKWAKMKVNDEDERFFSIVGERERLAFIDKLNEKRDRIAAIRKRMKEGEFVAREEFLEVKQNDAKNWHRGNRQGRRSRGAGLKVQGGYGTKKK